MLNGRGAEGCQLAFCIARIWAILAWHETVSWAHWLSELQIARILAEIVRPPGLKDMIQSRLAQRTRREGRDWPATSPLVERIWAGSLRAVVRSISANEMPFSDQYI